MKLIKDLPYPINKLALLRCNKVCTENDALNASFLWEATPEGQEFWSEIYRGYQDEEHFEIAYKALGLNQECSPLIFN